MGEFWIGILSALWLGVLTSISPCPLATNIAAVSYLSKRITHPRAVLLSGVSYAVGRAFAYAIVGFVIVKLMLSVPLVSNFLQKYMNKALGPILIIVGLFLLDVLKINVRGLNFSEKYQKKFADAGMIGAFILGFIFALSFCPLSAALFFGSLIPLAVSHRIGLSLPFIYGIGTALPVLIFALGLTLGVTSLNQWFYRTVKLEIYAKKITAIIFIAAGIYYTAIYIF